jgi:hypothetical protein
MADDSNIDEVAAWEKALIDSFDFTRPGTDQSLGRDMAGDVAEGIHERTVDRRQDVDGNKLVANEYHYAAWKAETLNVYQPLVKTGQMTSLLSLIGDVTVTPNEIVMSYGTGDQDAEGATDRDKAAWNSGKWPFYAIDDLIVAKLVDRAADAFDRAARESQ